MSGASPVVRARFKPGLKADFDRFREARNLTESDALKLAVARLLQDEGARQLTGPDAGQGSEIELQSFTFRVPKGTGAELVKRAAARGWVPSRWLSAFMQTHLDGAVILSDAELMAVEAQTRELAALGRNINQIAKALNIAHHETERVKLEMLSELAQVVKESRAKIRELIKAGRGVMGAE